MKPILRALCLGGLIAVVAGCNPKGGNGSADGVVELMKRLAPTSKLPSDGVLELPGASIPVTIDSSTKGNSFVIELTTFGEILESESYSISNNQFALQSALGETYDPVAPLLGQGTSLDRPWMWKGVISSGGVKRKATAEIHGKSETIKVIGFNGPGRTVTMNLSIESGESVKAERILSFHFAEDKGLLQRDFGQASTRTLAKPDSDSGGSSEPDEPIKL